MKELQQKVRALKSRAAEVTALQINAEFKEGVINWLS
jgi:hypothetical protein